MPPISSTVLQWSRLSFKFLGVHFTNKLKWSKHTKTAVKMACKTYSPSGD